MNDEERKEIIRYRDFQVFKSNDLALNSRYRYTAREQRTIAFICSLIQPTPDGKEPKLEYTFELSDYCKIVGIKKSGEQYSAAKETLKKLRDKSMWLKRINEKGRLEEVLVAWLSKVKCEPNDGTVTVTLDVDMIDYLFYLQERFYNYGMWNILYFRSMYSQHIYEIFKAWYGLERAKCSYSTTETPTLEYIVTVEELQHTLMTDEPDTKKKYKNFGDFRRYVIEPAQRDINQYSDLNFEFEPITKGRKTVKVKFYIKQKDTIQRLETMNKAFTV